MDWFLAFLNKCTLNLLELPTWLVDGGKRFFWVYILGFAVLGGISYRLYRNQSEGLGFRAFLGFLFPPKMYSHPSAILDYKLFLCNRILTPAGLLGKVIFGGLLIATVAEFTEEAVLDTFGAAKTPTQWTWPLMLGFTVGIALVSDFSTFVVHALHHRIPFLWPFHKVHHSAEVLTPITIYRKHPVYTLLSHAFDLALIGPFQGLVAVMFPGDSDTLTLFGANAVFAIYNTFGSNLRHSHIWLSFGPILSRIVISPAQHQIHHSVALEHRDKNFGEVFALWDWLFGTLYIPREKETIRFGVTGEATQPHDTLWRTYSVPFVEAFRILAGWVSRRKRGLALPR